MFAARDGARMACDIGLRKIILETRLSYIGEFMEIKEL